ncbi:MAG: 30S ribosomal protein S12 methylthiotransferase RimO, partial [Candidatus Hydrothermia bacterium]
MRIFIFTLGCPKNIVDSERLAGTLYAQGHDLVFSPDEADLIVLNTCAFISEAEKEAQEHIEALSKKAPLAVIGCLPARRRRFQKTYGETPPGTEEILMLARMMFWNPDQGTRFLDEYPYAYLKIAEGCSRRCSFCVIPWIRGRLRSRGIGSILDEARAMLELGKKEIILVAQDT